MIQTQMQKRTLRVLEFTKIREQLADLAVTEMGREICLALEPETNLEEVRLIALPGREGRDPFAQGAFGSGDHAQSLQKRQGCPGHGPGNHA